MHYSKTLSPRALTLSLAMAMAMPLAAHADDGGFSWRFSGFGTIGYVDLNNNDLLFTNPGQLKGARDNGSWLVDTRLGGQFDFTFTPKLSATVQAIAMQDAKGRFWPQVEWAFLRYKLSDDFTARLGRLGRPAYQVSDYRYVGFAMPWVRPPLEIYTLAPLDSFEGGDLSWTHDAGGGYFTLQGFAGHASTPMPDTTETTNRLKVNQMIGLVATWEIGNLRVRGGGGTAKTSYRADNIAQLIGGLRMTGFGRVADALVTDGARTTFVSLGGSYDSGPLMLMGEYAKLHSSSEVIGNASGWYGTAGYRLGKWMPYATWAGYSKRDDSRKYAVPAIGPLLPLSAGVDKIVGGSSQHTTSVGVRVDAIDNVAVKAQIDHVLPATRGRTFNVVYPGYNGRPVNIYSVVVDFTF